jgi:hypothetical protein
MRSQLRSKNVEAATNADELCGFESSVYEAVTTPRGIADDTLELALGEGAVSQTSCDEAFGGRLRIRSVRS